MTWTIGTLFEKELKNPNDFYEKFSSYKENWHSGETFKYENELEQDDERYLQLRTDINNDIENDYFIYDEVIKYNNRPILLLILHNDKKREMLQGITYLDNNEVVQQIRKLTYEQFFHEVEKANYEVLKRKEDENTTIIKTPFLDFITNINEEEQLQQELKQKKKWKTLVWWIVGFVVTLVIWCAFPIISHFLITPLLEGVISEALMMWLPSVIASLVVGIIGLTLNCCESKLKTSLFPNQKAEYESKISIESVRQLDLSLSPQAKQERMLNAFVQLLNMNKNKDFETLSQELNDKFNEPKNMLQGWTKIQKKQYWDSHDCEKHEFINFLKNENITDPKIAKTRWETWQEEQVLVCINSLWEESLPKNDIRSPISKFREMGLV